MYMYCKCDLTTPHVVHRLTVYFTACIVIHIYFIPGDSQLFFQGDLHIVVFITYRTASLFTFTVCMVIPTVPRAESDDARRSFTAW
jgi:hypothetical protein